MKITTKVLCRRTKGSLSKAQHLDMSQLGMGTVEGLENCPRLESLDISNNCLEELENFECCKQLWRINISNNKISCLNGFSKIYALGSLDLSNNRIPWKELTYLRNVYILDLRLHGNSTLENDTYYRLHVIDCLPNIWMLDGRLVTSAERLQVTQFFHDSALSSRPVRHKLTINPFRSSNSDKSRTVYGERTCQFAQSFPSNEAQNSECDKRRLEFLAKSVQQDLKLRSTNTKEIRNHPTEDWLYNLVKYRYKEKERCNMLLLLLIASLEFKVPVDLLKQTVDVAKLNPIFGVDCKTLFDLDTTAKTEAICLLVSACKLDRDIKGKTDGHFSSGGLYDRLYLCLYHAVAHLISFLANESRKHSQDIYDVYNDHRPKSRPRTAPPKLRSPSYCKNQSKHKSDWKVHQRLLGSELVLLLSVVPSFYNYIALKNQSMCKLLYIATGDPRLASRLGQLAEELSIEGGDINALYHEICRSVKKRIQYAAQNTSKGEVVTEVEDGNSSHNIHLNVGKLSENTKEARFILNAAYYYPKRPKSAVLSSGEHLITGRSRPATTPHGVQTTKSLINPHLELGSQILLGAQNLARVIALPEQNVALVQMDSVPAPNGSVVVQTRDMEQHYCYVDVNLLEFDVFTGYWRPQGSVGDRVTLQGPTLLTEHGDVTCLEVDKGKSLQETKHQMMIAWVQDVDEKAVKPEEWNSKLSHATKKSRKTDKRTPTNTWGNMTEEKVIAPTTQPPTNAVTLRPLSSMFCEKMDLSLSASVLESGMMPLNIGTDPDIAWTNRQQPHDLQQNSTFLTEEGNLGMEKAQLEINLNLPSETEDLENVRMEMWSTDNESKLYVGRIESVGQYKTDSEFSVQLQRETGTNMDNKTLLNEGYNSDVQQNETPHTEPHRVIANSQDKQNVLQSSVENNVEEQHMKKPTLATIRIPSFESNENETVHTMDPESQNPELSGATVNDDHVMCTSNRNVDNEDSDKEEAEIQTTGISTIIIGSTAVGEDVSLGDDESKLTGTENKSYQNSKQRSSKKTARRVQSARVPENVETKTSSLVTRPYSAVVTRPKHVVFGNNECDSDSRPGSASSFQLQRTEAWRSSASSGSAALGESAVQKTFDFSSFSARTQTNANTQKVKFSVGMHKPPPQRPTSPDQHNIESYRETSPIESSHEARSASQSGRSSVEPKSASKSLSLSRAFEPPKGSTLLASSWLAQGRDVHYEKQIHRRLITSPRLPGYLEGTSMMPPKPKKATETRPTKVATKLSQSPLRRSFEGHNLPQSALGGSLVWSKPRFSALQELKKLTNKPGRPQKSHPSQNGFPRKTI